MKRILLLSDTHSYLDERIIHYSKEVNEIWHAGDIGRLKLSKLFDKPLRGVYGNIDSQEIRAEFPLDQRFFCEKIDVLMTHIGGVPKKYDPRIEKLIKENPPKLFICGHSHILKILFDKTHSFLYINPGAAGKYGFHKIRTMVRFLVEGNKISNVEVIELGET